MRELSKKQKGFCDDYLEHGNGTKAAENNYNVNSEHSAASIGSENLRKPDIRQYLEENARGAAGRIVGLSKKAKNENVKLQANKDILDRTGYKPIEKIETKSEITLNLTEKEKQIAEKIKNIIKEEL